MFEVLQFQITQELAYGLAGAFLILGLAIGFLVGRRKREVIAITKKIPAGIQSTLAPQVQTKIMGEVLPELLPPGAKFVTESNPNDLFGLYHVFGPRIAGQQFLASGDSLKEASVKAYRIGMPSSLVLEIRSDAGDVPSQEVLATQAVEGAIVTTNYAGDWISASVSCALAKGSKYWIVAKLRNQEGDPKNKIVLKGVYRDAYHEGISAESADFGSSWQKRQYSDIAFKAVMQLSEASKAEAAKAEAGETAASQTEATPSTQTQSA